MQSTPLQPLRVADLLDLAIRLYRAHAIKLLQLCALLIVPMTLVRLAFITSPTINQLFASLQSIVLLPLLGAVLTLASARAYWHETISSSQVYRSGARRLLSVLGAFMLEGLIMVLPLAVVGGVMVAVVLAASSASPLAWIVPLLLGVPIYVAISAKYAVMVPVIMLEQVGASTGLSRSWRLTSGRFWPVVVIVVATSLLTIVVAQLPSTSLAYFSARASASGATVPWLATAQLVLEQVGLLIALPLQYLIPTVLYYDLRIRQEGLDLEQAGQAAYALASRAGEASGD
jgi:hypothetical protein